MKKLLNSAMMPNLDCVYDCRSCGPYEFARYLQAGPFESYIGYPETARILEELSGVKIPISRAQTTVEPGDTLLIARLKYRLGNPADKGKTTHTLDDFEFAVCEVE
jgi:hypothetical protein